MSADPNTATIGSMTDARLDLTPQLPPALPININFGVVATPRFDSLGAMSTNAATGHSLVHSVKAIFYSQ